MSLSLQVPLNDLGRLYGRYGSAIETEVMETLRSGWWINGTRARDFAERFAEYVGAAQCIPVANGTDALELALRTASAAQADKDEVVTVANAGGYTTTATFAANLVPVYADIEASTQLLSVPSALASITQRTLAVVATHLYGAMADVAGLRDGLRQLGREDIVIIEDCAQAHGAGTAGRRAGSLGDIAAFSFYPTKNLGAMGDAGAIVTSSQAMAESAKRLHQYGWASKYTISQPGGRNSRMDEVQAAILNCLLPHLNECNEERAAILAAYRAACPDTIRPIERPAGSVVHLAVVLCEQRDALRSFLKDRGISTDIHYPILDCDQPGWRTQPLRAAPGDIPQSRQSAPKLLTLPCFVGMTKEEIDHVSHALSEFPSP